MELRIRREQSTSGMVRKKVAFVLKARGLLNQDEATNIKKYGLGDEVIYNSEAARKHLESGRAALDSGGVGGLASGMARIAMTKMSLNITIDSLTRDGHVITCSSLDEAIGAEEALKEACEAATKYIAVASLFDGSEETFTY